MNNWLLVKDKENISKISSFDNQIALNFGFVFSFTLAKDNYYYDDELRSGIFVFGYFARRLSKNEGKFDLKDLFHLLTKNPDNLNNEIKGIFTILIINNGNFSIINDPLGISKFFYTDNLEMYAGRINFLKELTHPQLSKNHLLEYYVFNYCLNGHTFFQNIKYASPASICSLSTGGQVSCSAYFDIQNYLATGIPKLTKKEMYREAPEIWMKIIRQWQEILNGKKVSLTLTAGLDSRIILGSFLKSGYENFDTFTFGHERTSDVVFAKELAQKYSIPHRHLYPEEDFFDNFSYEAEKVFKAGDSLVSIFRAHRLDAYEKVMGFSSGIFMGMAGSDLVRGIGYDGLIISKIANYCWKNKSLFDFFDNDEIRSRFSKLGFNSFDYLKDNNDKYNYISHPLLYIFNVIIPLHFSQDITLSSNNDLKTYLPFLDFDYLDFLRETGFINVKEFGSFEVMNNKRRVRGLRHSAKLAWSLNSDLAKFTLGKGYSADDLANYELWAYAKGIYWKLFIKKKKKYLANLPYEQWFWNYLNTYFTSNNISDTGINANYLAQRLKTVSKSGGELHFLDFAKAVNIHLSTKL
jgi:hypothetical protein